MAKKNKEMKKGQQREQRQRQTENAPGYGDKKLDGPNRPST